MNREIKFRAWYPYSKRVNKEWIGIMITDKKLAELFRMAEINDYRLMQYTGLKDKNGVEIYEGDIVIFNKENSRVFDRYRVEWVNSGLWAVRILDNYQSSMPYSDRDYVEFYPLQNTSPSMTATSCEVIGNIYENPELLK